MQTNNSNTPNSQYYYKNRNRNRRKTVNPEIVSSTESKNSNILEKISDDTIAQLDMQERLIEISQQGNKHGPIHTLLNVAGNMFSQTGPGKLLQKMAETNARNKLQRLNRRQRNRFQEEIAD